MSFNGRTILITGAASGIGLATARSLAELGAARFILTDVDAAALARVGADDAWGCTLDLIPGDVTDVAH